MYEAVVDISRRLRKMGVRTGVSESIDACNALSILPSPSMDDVKTAIKITMVKDFSKYGLFDSIFEETLMQSLSSRDGEGGEGESEEGEGAPREGEESIRPVDQNQRGQDRVSVGLVMYSPLEVLNKRTIKPVEPDKLREGKRIVKRLRRRIALLPGRRWRPSRRGDIDFVKSFRKSLSTVAELIELKKTTRIKSRARLLVFVDISGSMDSYTDWLVRAMYLLKRSARRVELFVFSTRLMRITDVLSSPSPEEISKRLYEKVDLWGSGTRIGHCLRTFLENFGSMVDRSWVIVIISDGWDTGEPEVLKRSLEMLRLRAGRIIWLNPHADKPNFRPMTVGMITALPYIDVLAGTSVLEDYRSFIRFFGPSIKPMKQSEQHVIYAR